MKVLVIGATGGTGRETVRQAVERGHAVTAFVRDPAKLETFEGRVKVVTGSLPGNVEALAQATQEQEAVISALGVERFA